MRLPTLSGLWRSWIEQGRAQRKPASVRLTLEALEHRAVPAFLAPVNSVGGGAVTLADLNRDGLDDIVAITGKSTLSVSLSKGDGTFLETSALKVQNQTLTQALVSDLNGDGHLDIKAWGWNNPSTIKKNQGYDCIICGIRSVDEYVNVWLGNGAGTFGPRATAYVGRGLESGPDYRQSTLADFNSDGILDRATIENRGTELTVYLGAGDGSHLPLQTYPAGSGTVSVAAGDFNGDGWIDVIVTNQMSSRAPYTLSVLFNDGIW